MNWVRNTVIYLNYFEAYVQKFINKMNRVFEEISISNEMESLIIILYYFPANLSTIKNKINSSS